VTWLQPFVFLALLLETNTKTALDGDDEEGEKAVRPSASEDLET
jgi:hypothetical protein